MWLSEFWQDHVLGLLFGYTPVGRYSSDCMERLVSADGQCQELAFSAEASARQTDSRGSLILDISFWSTVKQIQFVNASLAEM